MYSVPHFFVIILLLNKFGNVGIHYLRLVIYLYTAISGNPSKLLEIVCPNPISLASAAPIRPTLLPLRAKKKPPMPWKKPLMSFQVPSIKDVDISFLIFWHLLLLSIIFFFWKTSMKFDPSPILQITDVLYGWPLTFQNLLRLCHCATCKHWRRSRLLWWVWQFGLSSFLEKGTK